MKEKIKENFISNYTIDSYYGRYGNNLQQIGLAIMYANLYKRPGPQGPREKKVPR